MDIEKAECCWSCHYSDFNPSSGKLGCSANEGSRPDYCPFTVAKEEKAADIENHSKRRQLGEWRKQASNA